MAEDDPCRFTLAATRNDELGPQYFWCHARCLRRAVDPAFPLYVPEECEEEDARQPALELIHRLLRYALIEMRTEGQGKKTKLMVLVASLFNKEVLDLEAVADGKLGVEDVIQVLNQLADKQNCEPWLEPALARIK